MNIRLFFLVTGLTAAITTTLQGQPDGGEPFSVTSPVKYKLEALRFGEIKPTGWLKIQMQGDLDGFVGHLDELVPGLMQDSIYGKDRLTKAVKTKNVGNIGETPDPQYLWWNSETQSNWRDGYIRNAILLGDRLHLARVEKYVRYILSTQDKDGYLGIYAPDLRYNFRDENGELWSKATLLRGLLAWYEYTGRAEILNAVRRAVADVMVHYPAGGSSPFRSEKPFAGGVTHGLMITDVLDRLYQLTGDETYRRYSLFLYRDFSENNLREDAQYAKIMDTSYKLKEHGVHTFEHLRALVTASFASGNQQLKNAVDIYLGRIGDCTTPSGAPIGDEWVGRRVADATNTGYEYCSLQELLDGYAGLLQKTGEARFGQMIETLFFNAAQGARNPGKSSIAYCKTDNSYEMTGTLNGAPAGDQNQTRYKYSPAHQDVAVCCVPNAGRISPYFVKSMWMKDGEGLVATLPGPNTLVTTLKGTKVQVIEETAYPFGYNIEYLVTADRPVAFKIKIRRSEWAKKVVMNCPYTESEGYIIIDKTWDQPETIRMELRPEIIVRKDQNRENYFTFGPLVFALPLESREIVSKVFPVKGFTDTEYKPVTHDRYLFPANRPAEVVAAGKPGKPGTWSRLTIKTSLVNATTGKTEPVLLKPLGATILRQVTFRDE